ncbi:MAG: hypothetical protein UV60_C0032G0014 [Parcubacteria group bacterium GW2011_GWA2_43_11]|nr:MAG: hypothetical protein UU89_C0019G0009 [Parcubacteria group bacterium GW2011_GWC2_42_11]KKS83845.1 MAG: hypothetical protein UV60_C0032G0014 [Parcubacteria group bacterium GW2011_GWA2_43_11]
MSLFSVSVTGLMQTAHHPSTTAKLYTGQASVLHFCKASANKNWSHFIVAQHKMSLVVLFIQLVPFCLGASNCTTGVLHFSNSFQSHRKSISIFIVVTLLKN